MVIFAEITVNGCIKGKRYPPLKAKNWTDAARYLDKVQVSITSDVCYLCYRKETEKKLKLN